jgi:Ser/Thr protein kinase RdoA (MazF antagonist)
MATVSSRSRTPDRLHQRRCFRASKSITYVGSVVQTAEVVEAGERHRSLASTQDRELAHLALAQFDVSVVRVTLAAVSFNTIFRVASQLPGPMALRVGPPLRIHAGGTAAVELAWLRRLRSNRIKAPTIMPTRQGAASATVLDPEGRERTCVLGEWIAGRSLAKRLTAHTCNALGQLSARLHLDAARWTPSPTLDVLAASEVLYWRLPAELSDAVGLLPAGIFNEALHSARSAVRSLWTSGRDGPHLLHGDLTPTNVIIDTAGALVPIDFQDMVVGFDVQDIAITVSALRRNDVAEHREEAFRVGYSRIRPWPEVSPETFNALILARRLNVMSLTLARLGGAERNAYADRCASELVSLMSAPTGI